VLRLCRRLLQPSCHCRQQEHCRRSQQLRSGADLRMLCGPLCALLQHTLAIFLCSRMVCTFTAYKYDWLVGWLVGWLGSRRWCRRWLPDGTSSGSVAPRVFSRPRVGLTRLECTNSCSIIACALVQIQQPGCVIKRHRIAQRPTRARVTGVPDTCRRAPRREGLHLVESGGPHPSQPRTRHRIKEAAQLSPVFDAHLPLPLAAPATAQACMMGPFAATPATSRGFNDESATCVFMTTHPSVITAG
jgi:hypothetical protein